MGNFSVASWEELEQIMPGWIVPGKGPLAPTAEPEPCPELDTLSGVQNTAIDLDEVAGAYAELARIRVEDAIKLITHNEIINPGEVPTAVYWLPEPVTRAFALADQEAFEKIASKQTTYVDEASERAEEFDELRQLCLKALGGTDYVLLWTEY